MPYIDQVSRRLFDPYIKQIKERVSATLQQRPGEMNYIISQLIRQVYGEHLKYHEYNEILGFLSGVDKELYRRRVAPYEDKKLLENSDLYIDKP
jgi:hypothetical protein